jgi:hypothetical protein
MALGHLRRIEAGGRTPRETNHSRRHDFPNRDVQELESLQLAENTETLSDLIANDWRLGLSCHRQVYGSKSRTGATSSLDHVLLKIHLYPSIVSNRNGLNRPRISNLYFSTRQHSKHLGGPRVAGRNPESGQGYPSCPWL